LGCPLSRAGWHGWGVCAFDHHSDVQARTPPDVGLAQLAGAQWGVVSRGQLRALGFGRGAIERRLSVGRLHVVHRGVYAVGHRALRVEGRWLAAVLACGDGAVLSHRSAAAHWGLLASQQAVVDVTDLSDVLCEVGVTDAA
jgi:hypothetical protein